MKNIICTVAIMLAWASMAHAAGKFPIKNGRLETDLNANRKAITNCPTIEGLQSQIDLLEPATIEDLSNRVDEVESKDEWVNESGDTMTGDLDMGVTNRVSGYMFGPDAGVGASGEGWKAFGDQAGMGASGNYWSAYGDGAGVDSVGDLWWAYGFLSGAQAVHTNVFSSGIFAGHMARGSNRFYMDVYGSWPGLNPGYATNDVIFGDDGYLYLGRGAGAPGGMKGGELRGDWTITMGGVRRTAWPGAVEIGAAPSVHGHEIGDVTNLQSELDAKAGTGDVSNVGSNLTAHINNPTAAHPASAISATGTYANVQAAINAMGTGSLTASQATNIAQTVLETHTGDTTEAHAQSEIDAVRTITTIAVGQAAGTQTVAFAWGETKRVRILATNSAVVVRLDWPDITATNRTRFLRAEVANPNLRSLIYADAGNWASNTSWVTTAPPNGKYRVWSVCNDGDEYEIIPVGGTNATERGAP